MQVKTAQLTWIVHQILLVFMPNVDVHILVSPKNVIFFIQTSNINLSLML